AAQPKLAAELNLLKRDEAGRAVFPEVEKRLACEGMLTARSKHDPGHFDEPMREALIRFQRKHKIYDGAGFRKDTMAALARTLLENDHLAVERVLTERAVA